MCPRCRSIDREWVATSGRGRIWSYVVPHPPLLPAYSPLAPYNVVVVELDDPDVATGSAVRFVGNLVAGPVAEINSIDAATIAIGEPVRVVFTTVGDVTLPRWIRAT
jgi:uncharacterized OB-fold protein